LDTRNEVLYVKTLDVTKSDFGTYIRGGTTDDKILLHQWYFAKSDVKKGLGSYATAKIVFTAKDGKTFTSTTNQIPIEQLRGVELQQAYEDAYLKNSIEVDKTVNEAGFSITLVRVGYFNHLKYDTWGDEVINYRADFVITNVSDEYQYTPSQFLIVDDGSNQYDPEYFGGTLDWKEVYPDVTIKGYKLFDKVSEDASWIKVIVKDTNYPEDDIWEYKVDLK
jgi:hypothetical protein